MGNVMHRHGGADWPTPDECPHCLRPERDALRSEVARLRAFRDTVQPNLAALRERVELLTAERDALQAAETVQMNALRERVRALEGLLRESVAVMDHPSVPAVSLCAEIRTALAADKETRNDHR